jgi:hypothetical protein
MEGLALQVCTIKAKSNMHEKMFSILTMANENINLVEHLDHIMSALNDIDESRLETLTIDELIELKPEMDHYFHHWLKENYYE